jgi:hypothetical protein
MRTLISDDLLTIIDIESADWRQQINTALVKTGTVRLTAAPDAQQNLRMAAIELAGAPVEADAYHFYPTVEAYRSLASGRIALDFSLRERV